MKSAKRTRKSVRRDCADMGVVVPRQYADMPMSEAKKGHDFDAAELCFSGLMPICPQCH